MNTLIYLTAGYSYVDPADNISTPAIPKSGEAPFYRDRWSVFTTTILDPVDDLSSWAVGVYGNTPIYSNSRWATWWAISRSRTTPPVRHRAARH